MLVEVRQRFGFELGAERLEQQRAVVRAQGLDQIGDIGGVQGLGKCRGGLGPAAFKRLGDLAYEIGMNASGGGRCALGRRHGVPIRVLSLGHGTPPLIWYRRPRPSR